MTVEEVAEVLNARPAGRGRWLARCPVHGPDRHPSLSIGEGKDGRVLLLCRSHNCPPEQIVSALGLTMGNLFSNAPSTPAERRHAAETRAILDEHARRQRAVGRQQCDRVYKLGKLMDAIGAQLIRRPDDDSVAALFHAACDKFHQVESALYHDPQDGPMRLPEPSAVPGWIHRELTQISQDFFQKEKAACEAA